MGGTLGKEVYGQKFVERLSALGAAKGNPNVNFSDKPFFFFSTSNRFNQIQLG